MRRKMLFLHVKLDEFLDPENKNLHMCTEFTHVHHICVRVWNLRFRLMPLAESLHRFHVFSTCSIPIPWSQRLSSFAPGCSSLPSYPTSELSKGIMVPLFFKHSGCWAMEGKKMQRMGTVVLWVMKKQYGRGERMEEENQDSDTIWVAKYCRGKNFCTLTSDKAFLLKLV